MKIHSHKKHISFKDLNVIDDLALLLIYIFLVSRDVQVFAD